MIIFSKNNYIRIRWTDFRSFFSPNESVLGADNLSRPLFPISQRQTILWKKWQTPLFRRSGIPKRNGISLPSNSRVDRAHELCHTRRSQMHLWTSGTTRPKKLAYLVEYLRIYWTDFCNLFTIWKRFGCRWWISTLLFDLSRDVAI